MSVVDRKNVITEKIMEISQSMENLPLKKQINKLHAELVLVDTMDISNLITYGYDCLNLAVETIGKDSLKAIQLSKISIEAANKLRLYRTRGLVDLIDAAKIYTFNGLFDKNYYDTADAIYSRIIILIENDSLKVPAFAENDKVRYFTELKETVHDLRFYNGMAKRFQLRKYIRK